MGLSSTRSRGIRVPLANSSPTIPADLTGIRTDIELSAWGSGPVLPTNAADKWPGRIWFHTGKRCAYVCDGSTWLPFGGHYEIPVTTFGSLASGFKYSDAEIFDQRIIVDGPRIVLKLRIERITATDRITHGQTLLTIASAFRPPGIGVWPQPSIQISNAANGVPGILALRPDGNINAVSPASTTNGYELNGSYYLGLS